MIRLDKATRSLRAVLGGAVAATQPDVVVSFTDKGSSIGRGFDQRAKLSTTNGATPVTICDAPNVTTIREIDFVSIRNNDSASVTVTVSILDGSTSYSLITATLATLEHLHYSAMTGWIALGTDGRIKTKVASSAVPWETPGTIGSTTPNTGKFTTLEVTTSSVFPAGDWTPAIKFGGGDTGITYSVRAASYTRIGNRVLISGFIALTDKGSSTGSAAIHGLPFTVNNANDSYSPVSMRIENITYTGTPQGYAAINTTQINLEHVTEAGANAALTDANFANNSSVLFRIEYRA